MEADLSEKMGIGGLDEDGAIKRCVLYGMKYVVHFYDGKSPRPDCENCDGYGLKSSKNNWGCYKPAHTFIKREFRK